MEKVVTPAEAVRRSLSDGMTLMVGGFGLVGFPLTLIAALNESPVRDLTIVSNNLPWAGVHLGRSLQLGKLRRVIGTYFTTNPDVARAREEGRLEVTLLPQGTLVEAMRCAGAGLGGFYTPAGVGTLLAEGREVRQIHGRSYLFQEPLRADVAFVRAHQADRLGNLLYRKTARNFNPVMATAARRVVAEVDEVVDVGRLDPERIGTPHLLVDAIVVAEVRP